MAYAEPLQMSSLNQTDTDIPWCNIATANNFMNTRINVATILNALCAPSSNSNSTSSSTDPLPITPPIAVQTNNQPAANTPQGTVATISTQATEQPNPIPSALTTTQTVPTNDVPVPATLPIPIKDLWDRLRMGFSMSPHDNPKIAAQMNVFTQHPNRLKLTIDRSKLYLYHVVSELEKRGMPTELALLPFVESAYNPMAYSASHAAGIWQFIPQTAKNFGLRQTNNYDGRRDVIAATNAALDYLNQLHKEFGKWDLSLAAYNCGEGCVTRAIQRNQALGLPTDYQSLRLPAETEEYVPKLLALKRIVLDPSNAGVSLDDIPNQAYFTEVPLKKSMDVKLAAKMAEMPVDAFISLNPASKSPVITANTTSELLLPIDKAETFNNNLEQYKQALVTWKTCIAPRGASPKKIATTCHASLHVILSHNTLRLNRKGKLIAEQTLNLPNTTNNTHISSNETMDKTSTHHTSHRAKIRHRHAYHHATKHISA